MFARNELEFIQFYLSSKTLKYWVGVQQGQSYLMGEKVPIGHPSSDGVTIKITYGVDVLLHRQASHPIPIGLVKTESNFIVRSFETDLGRWMLVVAVINVDAYPFFAFSDLSCHLEDT